jgi:hypothetical protein
MPNYEKGTLGKIIVQDWNILEHYSDAVALRWISPRQCAALIALAEFLAWKTRYGNPPGQDTLDAFEAETRYNLMTEVAFCALMIGCITTDTDVQTALLEWLLTALDSESVQDKITNINYYNNNPGLPSKPGTSTNILRPADCIKDNAAGYVRTGIVDRAFDNIYQMFDVMILATTDEQKKAAFFDFIPILGELSDLIAYEDAVTFVGNVTVWIKAQFEAEDSPSLRTKYYRDLLCLYMNGCSLSVEQIRDYFWQQATTANSGFNDAIGTAVDLYNFLMNGTATSFVGIVPVLMGVQFGGAYFISNLFGMPLEQFKFFASLGDPTDDWIAWEAEHGICECWYEYRKPDNPIPDLTLIWGLIGISEVLAASTNYQSGDDTAWIITTNPLTPGGIPVENMSKVWIITDSPDIVGGEVYGDVFFENSTDNGFFIAPGEYANEFIFDPPVTGNIIILNFRKAIGNPENFLWKALRIFQPC